MKPKSATLFHFTKSLDVLKLILDGGIQPRFCLEDVEWFYETGDNYIAYPMSCFCDIPLSRISEHTDFYGSYGIGLSKEWGIKNELNPVIYCPPNGHVMNAAKALMENRDKKYDSHFFRLVSLIKPIIGRMVITGEVVHKDFYQENEWRYVPDVLKLIKLENYEELYEKYNKQIKKHALKFTPNDIKYLFVPCDSDIPNLIDFINNSMGDFSLNDLKILQSRIVSLETLRCDL